MLTKFKTDLKIKKDPVGYVIGNHSDGKLGDEIPLYIPRLMSNIEKSVTTKTTNIVQIDNTASIFVNDKKCRPKTKTRIKCRNYILAKIANSSPGDLKAGDKVICELQNDSPTNIYFKKG